MSPGWQTRSDPEDFWIYLVESRRIPDGFDGHCRQRRLHTCSISLAVMAVNLAEVHVIVVDEQNLAVDLSSGQSRHIGTARMTTQSSDRSVARSVRLVVLLY